MTLSICDSCIKAADNDLPGLHCHNKLLCACQCRHGETQRRINEKKAHDESRNQASNKVKQSAGE